MTMSSESIVLFSMIFLDYTPFSSPANKVYMKKKTTTFKHILKKISCLI